MKAQERAKVIRGGLGRVFYDPLTEDQNHCLGECNGIDNQCPRYKPMSEITDLGDLE